MQVIRVRNPVAFEVQLILDLFERAFAEHPRTSAKDAIEGLRGVIEKDNVGLFIGEHDGALKALAIVFLPVSRLHSLPQVYYFWSKGPAALREELVKAIVDYVTRAGYNRVWAINAVTDDDRHARLFRKFGAGRRIGSILEYEIGSGDGHTVRRRRKRKQEHAPRPDTDGHAGEAA